MYRSNAPSSNSHHRPNFHRDTAEINSARIRYRHSRPLIKKRKFQDGRYFYGSSKKLRPEFSEWIPPTARAISPSFLRLSLARIFYGTLDSFACFFHSLEDRLLQTNAIKICKSIGATLMQPVPSRLIDRSTNFLVFLTSRAWLKQVKTFGNRVYKSKGQIFFVVKRIRR